MTTHRTYWDVPENERHALTEDQIAQFCKVELAEAGYVYPKPPNVMLENPPKVPTSTFYRPQIDQFNRLDIAFSTMEGAAAFLKLSPVEVTRDYRTDTSYSKPVAGMSIEPVELPTEQQLDAVKQGLAEAKQNKDANAKARKEFDTDVIRCDDLVKGVRSDYRDRVSHEFDLQCVRDTYEEFLKIANGEALIATRFLLKQHDRGRVVEALGSQLAFDVEAEIEA